MPSARLALWHSTCTLRNQRAHNTILLKLLNQKKTPSNSTNSNKIRDTDHRATFRPRDRVPYFRRAQHNADGRRVDLERTRCRRRLWRRGVHLYVVGG